MAAGHAVVGRPRDHRGSRQTSAANRNPVPLIEASASLRFRPLTGRKQEPAADLPRPLTSLIGREREAANLRDLLCRDEVRLVTLTGPGGIGKTRLAIEVAATAASEFADGVAFVSLFTINHPSLVVPAIAHALAVRGNPADSLVAQLKLAMRAQQLLLLLDNFEHVLATAPVLADLLSAAPGLKILVTSRSRLHLSGEHDYPVPPLTVPREALDPSRSEVAESAAVRLFVARARAVRPDFALSADTTVVVAAICNRLDGLPLAIELAAARSKVLPPSAILDRLEQRLPLLTSGARDQPARHRSLRDAIAWSYDLLTGDEQALFQRLAVFAGGCTLDAAAAIVADEPVDVFELLASLVEKSLLLSLGPVGGEPRFGMLETIREFGLERLEAAGAVEQVQRRHAEFCLALVEGLAPRLKGPETIQGLDRLGTELPNLRAAVTWALASGEIDLALRLVAAIFPSFWFSRGDPNEGRRWLEIGLRQAATVPPRTRIDALDAAAMLAAVQGDYPHALALAKESRALAQDHDYPFGVARADFCLAMIAEWQHDFTQAASRYTAALTQLRELGDAYWIAMTLTSLAVIRHRQGDQARAAALAEEGLSWWRNVGNPWGIAMALTAAAAVLADRGDRGQVAALHREAIALWTELDDKRGIAGALAGLASVATDQGQPAQAARLLGAASAQIESIGIAHSLHPAEYERATAATRRSLGAAAFTTEWEAGRTLPPADAVALAVTTAGAAAAEDAAPAPFGLTGRELEVVRLLSRRATNKEIAAALFISPRTVGRHVDSILRKLDVDSRREVAALAATHDLA